MNHYNYAIMAAVWACNCGMSLGLAGIRAQKRESPVGFVIWAVVCAAFAVLFLVRGAPQ